ncbi:hypothetical protein BS50DRAFT_637850 [Corynespora cassiicola Philippines]|uniref:Uncharacterized protein n=1 Tax=Corynespora cassiicola Philippines TaxID=1448308 RepID=A0A2T2ND30_CORCC|nr:hypothetical protein BS50DRAFT_637850 [Corynespora cassiicola Philippines]
MEPPPVTEADLRRFHATHFPHTPIPQHFVTGAHGESYEGGGSDEFEDAEADDGLGYYEDGFKRTLTDEQIAIFRHSEIQAILRERRRQRDGNASPKPETAPMDVADSPKQHAPQAPVIGRPDVDETTNMASPLSQATGTPTSADDGVIHGRIEKPGFSTPNYTKVGARSRAQNAKKRNNYRKKERALKKEREKEARKNRRNQEAEESDEWDPWHQATGLDAIKDEKVELDY